MISFAVFASLLLGAYGAIPHAATLFQNSGRIVGGSDTEIGKYPYQISLEYFGSHNCGGSIISKDWVLTAAHCLRGAVAGDIGIRVGTSTKGQGGSLHPAAEIIYNPNFSMNTLDYDVGVVRVSVPFEFNDNVQPIALASSEPSPGTEVVVTGWGRLYEGGPSPSQLQEVRINIVSDNECSAEIDGVTDRMICAGVQQGGKGVCNGDSGGPVAVNGQVVAIVSWGINCAEDTLPQVYSNVASLKSWVSATTGVN